MKIKKNFYKFSLLYFIIIILVLYSFNSLSFIEICKGFQTNTLFVGGTGDKNYSKIQDAIDNSKENDTIIVFDGIYNESIVINKSINLVGLNKNSVFINANGSLYVFLIKSSYVNISGLTIQDSKIGIFVSGSEFLFNNFSGNNIFNNTEAVRLVNTSNNKILNNTIKSNNNFGIVLYESFNNIINDNLLVNNSKAIFLNRWSNNNTIEKNNLTENNVGISLDFSFNNYIIDNFILNNSYGVYLTNSDVNNITNNYIEFNNESGIYISNSNNNTISPNIFIKNNKDILLDTKPPDIKAPGFEFILFFVAIIFFICSKKHIL